MFCYRTNTYEAEHFPILHIRGTITKDHLVTFSPLRLSLSLPKQNDGEKIFGSTKTNPLTGQC